MYNECSFFIIFHFYYDNFLNFLKKFIIEYRDTENLRYININSSLIQFIITVKFEIPIISKLNELILLSSNFKFFFYFKIKQKKSF